MQTTSIRIPSGLKNMIEYENARARLCPNRTKATSPTEMLPLVYLTDIFPALRMSRKDSDYSLTFATA